jgi:hypothetical protein
LLPFFNKGLKELKIWTDHVDSEAPSRKNRDSIWVMHAGGDGMELPTRVQIDSDWLSHIDTTCRDLTTLQLEFALDISSADLAALLNAMPQLKSLRIGHEMNAVLGRDTVSTILTLPALKELSIDYQFNSSLLNDSMSKVSSSKILPQVSKLEIKFRDTESLALSILLANISNVERLSITLQTAAPEDITVLDPAFLVNISTIPKLSSLDLRLSPQIHLSCLGLTAITCRHVIVHFSISSCEDGNRNGMAQMYLTGRDLVYALISLGFLEVIEFLDLPSTVEATYDEAIIITHLINTLSPRHTSGFPRSS